MRKIIALAGIAAAGAAVAKKLGKGSEPAWHEPTPTPAPPTYGGSLSDPPSDTTDDAGAASPDEAIADAVEEPHLVSTPDEPLSETVLDAPLEVTADDVDPEARPE